jgi:hypothetical protein
MKPMPGLDQAAIDKLVAGLDNYIAQRQSKKDSAENAAWAEQFDNDAVILFALQLQREYDRRKPGAVQPRDREALEAAENEVVELVNLAQMIHILERRREDEANGVVERRPKPKLHVKSMAKLLPEAKQRLDPGAAKPERTGGRRGGEALVMPAAPEDEGVWLKGQIMSWSPRTWEGSVRAANGKEYKLATGVLARSGLTSLVVGMRCEFRVMGGECDWIRAAWGR